MYYFVETMVHTENVESVNVKTPTSISGGFNAAYNFLTNPYQLKYREISLPLTSSIVGKIFVQNFKMISHQKFTTKFYGF